MIDHPNPRSSHVIPTPRGGGVAIVVTFLFGSFLLSLSGFVPARIFFVITVWGGLVALVGFVDDHRHLPARIRFCVHVAAAIGALYYLEKFPALPWVTGSVDLGWIGYFIAVVSLVWLLNLYNFMDGIDAVAGLEAISVAGSGAFIIWYNHGAQGYAFWLLVLIAATAGFLVWNWPPAKIFMGDACSGFLGFILGVMAIASSTDGAINVWSWTILFGVFLVDATVTLIRRVFRGETFYKAHRSHAYQILCRRFCSHLKISLAVLGINLFWLFPLAFLASIFSEWGVAYMAFAFAPLIVLTVKVGAGTSND
ncbi:MAG: glycosyltransferase family 4 protein [Thermodesulfobacteriota bacterium]|nr:glycosyltransferase family 4 protein [Thermodesulfobacteriota bacterium]